ncbi:hypothetical protein [Paraferrimonas sp. SM1919]|uniref:hypothetical protein n=1 Tax=Paraferrimonas sp. SM1919 TaxID=2662263 RepID=UPI0013D1F480|nr:hypothetical protein [Paraferrimonas sp. SM1919]
MSDYLLLKLLHLLFFVYWLGGDLGTFYASRYVANNKLSEQQRSTALTIMMGVDQGPRICMALILAPGLQMAVNTGMITMPSWLMAVIWVICLAWLAMVLVLHFAHGKSFTKSLTQFDFGFRLVVIASCLFFAGTSLTGDGAITQDWLSYKLIVFAAMVACGLGIRLQLKPFIDGFGMMMRQGASAESDQLISSGLSRVRPYVYLIWVGLLVNAAFGIHLI